MKHVNIVRCSSINAGRNKHTNPPISRVRVSIAKGATHRTSSSKPTSNCSYSDFQKMIIEKQGAVLNNQISESERLAAFDRLKKAGIITKAGRIAKHYK